MKKKTNSDKSPGSPHDPVKPVSTGLGDTIKDITTFLGITSCEGCKSRNATLNRLFPYGSLKRPMTADEMLFLTEFTEDSTLDQYDMLYTLYNDLFRPEYPLMTTTDPVQTTRIHQRLCMHL